MSYITAPDFVRPIAEHANDDQAQNSQFFSGLSRSLCRPPVRELGCPLTRNRRFISFDRGSVSGGTCRGFTHLLCVAVAVMLVSASGLSSARAGAIYGTLSNFDIYNTTPEPSEGAEIELEGVHSSDVGGDFPAHYASRTISEYTDSFNNFAGTRITYTGYNFAGAPTPGSLLPNPNPTTTNGHALTYTAGGEHFGFWLSGAQPIATRFFWLNDNLGTYERIGTMPESVPGPTWTYVPPVIPGDAPVVQAAVRVPEAEVHIQNPDSIWMKVFKTELPHVENAQDLLEHLVSGDPNDPNVIVPQEAAETETEWELLEGGKHNGDAKPNGGKLDDKNNEAVVMRYEFYKYSGAYDAEHEPLSNWDGTGSPLDIGELGDFIAANMVAALLVDLPVFSPGDGVGIVAAGSTRPASQTLTFQSS